MKDFFLTPRGDLSIMNASSGGSKLEINFITTYSNALCINFFLEDTKPLKPSISGLVVNFNTKVLENDKEIRVISGEEAIEQAIKIRLMSSLGSIRGNENIGSKLEDVVHELMDSSNLKNRVASIIRDAVGDMFFDPEITISPLQTKYLNYSDGMIINIKDGHKAVTLEI